MVRPSLVAALAASVLAVGASDGGAHNKRATGSDGGSVRQDPDRRYVSLVQLIAVPERYDRTRVAVMGYAWIENEGDALYLHEEDFRRRITKNAIALEFPDGNASIVKHSGRHVIVLGRFTASRLGHMELMSGALEVESMGLLPDRTPGSSGQQR